MSTLDNWQITADRLKSSDSIMVGQRSKHQDQDVDSNGNISSNFAFSIKLVTCGLQFTEAGSLGSPYSISDQDVKIKL